MKKLMPLLIVLLSMGMTACKFGRASTAAERFVDNLNMEDPYFDDYELAKDPTLFDGYIIVDVGGGDYRAIDLADFSQSSYSSEYDFFWDNSFEVWYAGNNYYRDAHGNLFDKSEDATKDLLKMGGIVEQKRHLEIGKQLRANYGLSDERSLEVAKVLTNFKDLKKKRVITDRDANSFSTDLLGFDITTAMEAGEMVLSGDTSLMNELVDLAADTNGLSPEHARALMKEIVLK